MSIVTETYLYCDGGARVPVGFCCERGHCKAEHHRDKAQGNSGRKRMGVSR